MGTRRRGDSAACDSVLSGGVHRRDLSAGDSAVDGEGLRRGGDVERLLRVHARDHCERGGQYGCVGRAVRAGAESLPRRTARRCVWNRLRQRSAHHRVPEHLAVRVHC